jgi:hypothetical protein
MQIDGWKVPPCDTYLKTSHHIIIGYTDTTYKQTKHLMRIIAQYQNNVTSTNGPETHIRAQLPELQNIAGHYSTSGAKVTSHIVSPTLITIIPYQTRSSTNPPQIKPRTPQYQENHRPHMPQTVVLVEHQPCQQSGRASITRLSALQPAPRRLTCLLQVPKASVPDKARKRCLW